LRDDEPVYQYVSHLTIAGKVVDPADRIGQEYELIVYGDDAPSRNIYATLKDVQARDKYNAPKWRDYRGGSIPVVRPIPALALLNKERGTGRHSTWVNVAPRLVSDMLVLLASGRPTYVTLTEVKENRHLWIRRVDLQTTDPADE
jgi:hypothetical protein